jgi:tetratricopeptide (TPR) repeat protein
MAFAKGSRERFLALLVTILVPMLPVPSVAGPIDDCNQARDAQRQLRGCTAYLKLTSADGKSRAVALLNRANIFARYGRHDQALADYQSAAALDPANALIPYNCGNVYLDSGQPDRAEVAFSQAITLDDRFAFAYLNRGIAREAQGDYARAHQDYRHALELDSTISAARRRLEARRTE